VEVPPGVSNRKYDRHLRVELGVAVLLKIARGIEIQPVLAACEPAFGQLPDAAVGIGGAAADD